MNLPVTQEEFEELSRKGASVYYWCEIDGVTAMALVTRIEDGRIEYEILGKRPAHPGLN